MSIMSSETPKKDKKKKSKRKSHDIASETPVINGESGLHSKSDKKRHKKEKKKDKKKSTGNDAAPKSQNQPAALSPNQPISEKINSSNKQPGAIISILSSSKRESDSSPYQIKKIVGSAALLPSSLNSVPEKIKSLLHSSLLRYDAKLGGVLLSLEDDAKLLPLKDDETRNSRGGSKGRMGGRIIDDLPYVHYRFQVHGLVFCPRVGMKVG